MTALAIGALIAAVAAASGALAFAVWATRKVDALHNSLREATVVAETGRAELVVLHEKFKEAAEALADSKRRHLAEAATLSGLLKESREKLAAVDTPDGLVESMTRRPR